MWLRDAVLSGLPADAARRFPQEQLGLVYNDIRNLVEGNIVSSSPGADIIAAADQYAALRQLSRNLSTGAVLVLGLVTPRVGVLAACGRRSARAIASSTRSSTC